MEWKGMERKGKGNIFSSARQDVMLLIPRSRLVEGATHGSGRFMISSNVLSGRCLLRPERPSSNWPRAAKTYIFCIILPEILQIQFASSLKCLFSYLVHPIVMCI